MSTVCLSTWSTLSTKQIPCTCKTLLGNKAPSDSSDSDSDINYENYVTV